MTRKAVFLGVLAIVAVVATMLWRAYQPQPITLQGQVEAQQYLVSSKIPGRLGAVHVKRGDTVAQGDAVFRIDSPELEAKLTQVQAIDSMAQSFVSAIEGGTREERVAATKSEWKKAIAAKEFAEKSWQRVNNLANEGLVSGQTRDEAWTMLQVASRTEETAHEIHKLALAGARDETRDASKASKAATDSLTEEIRLLLADTNVNAHHSGVVSQVMLQPGELVPQGFPVVTLVDFNQAWVLFNVREDLLSHFKEGTKHELFIPALALSAPFTVNYIAPMGDYATWRATSPGQQFDMRTFEVELRPVDNLPDLRPGMSALLTLEP